MHVATLIFGLCVLVLPSLSASLSSDYRNRIVGSKRSHFDYDNNNEDFLSFFQKLENTTDQMIISENLSFPPYVFASSEGKVAEIISEYSESLNDTFVLDKLIDYSKFYPEETVYQILSKGEIRLMTMRLYYETYISDEKIGEALRNLFINVSCRSKILSIIRIHINLLLNDPDLITPKSVLIGFKNNCIDLFGILAERESTSGKPTINYSKIYQLFLKLYNEINKVHLTSSRDLYSFNKVLIKSFPDCLDNIDTVNLYRVASNLVYWDDVEELSQLVSSSTEIVIFIPEKCSSLLHFATEWGSLECLDFLLDLVHEIAILEPEIGGISPYVYALILNSRPVLDVYAKHGFNDETTVTIDAIPITAAEFAEQTKDPRNYEYFQSIIKK